MFHWILDRIIFSQRYQVLRLFPGWAWNFLVSLGFGSDYFGPAFRGFQVSSRLGVAISVN